MKIKHRVPVKYLRAAETVSPEYQAQVDASTSKAEVAYERARRRLESAERRQHNADQALLLAAAAGKRRRDLEREVRIAAELVELRRDELRRIESMMKALPASLQHRGRGSYRPLPQPGGIV